MTMQAKITGKGEFGLNYSLDYTPQHDFLSNLERSGLRSITTGKAGTTPVLLCFAFKLDNSYLISIGTTYMGTSIFAYGKAGKDYKEFKTKSAANKFIYGQFQKSRGV